MEWAFPTNDYKRDWKGTGMDRNTLAGMIDHTKLGPVVSEDQVRTLCAEADEYGFASVCIPSNKVALAAECLKHSKVKVCTVIGFPHGAHLPQVKAFEAQHAIDDGADELDMVIDVAALKAGNRAQALADVSAVCRVARNADMPVCVKVILEMALLEEREKVMGCEVCVEAGAGYVKTSTGFASGGATAEDVALMRRVVGPRMGVKAAGGMKTSIDALRMVEAGATRLGASAGIAIVGSL